MRRLWQLWPLLLVACSAPARSPSELAASCEPLASVEAAFTKELTGIFDQCEAYDRIEQCPAFDPIDAKYAPLRIDAARQCK